MFSKLQSNSLWTNKSIDFHSEWSVLGILSQLETCRSLPDCEDAVAFSNWSYNISIVFCESKRISRLVSHPVQKSFYLYMTVRQFVRKAKYCSSVICIDLEVAMFPAVHNKSTLTKIQDGVKIGQGCLSWTEKFTVKSLIWTRQFEQRCVVWLYSNMHCRNIRGSLWL